MKRKPMMDRKTANREWRDATRGAPDGVPTGRTVHAFAQRVEALAIAGCDKRHAAAKNIGCQLANIAFNWAQNPGYALTSDDVVMLDKLRRQWDEALTPNVLSGNR
jgi:hypothetical protein